MPQMPRALSMEPLSSAQLRSTPEYSELAAQYRQEWEMDRGLLVALGSIWFSLSSQQQ